MNSVINNIIAIDGGGRSEFQSDSLTYIWNSGTAELIKQDIVAFPLLSSVTKLSSNFPVRLRLYRSLRAQAIDLPRPLQVLPGQNSGILLEATFGGNSSADQLDLAPLCLITGLTQVPLVLEKLQPEAVKINLSIDLVK
jgi:hypothetical protein